MEKIKKENQSDRSMADIYANAFDEDEREARVEEFYTWLEGRQAHAVESAKRTWAATDETVQQAVEDARADWEYDQSMAEAQQAWYR